MHHRTRSVIKLQIKLISDKSPGKHLSRARNKKKVLSVNIRAVLGAYTAIYHTSALFSDTQINVGAVTTVTHKNHSSVSEVMMVKWRPPIIIICPVKPAYFIVHNISILLISLTLSLRPFHGFFSPISLLEKTVWNMELIQQVCFCFHPFQRDSLEGHGYKKQTNTTAWWREAQAMLRRLLCLRWWRGVLPSRRSWAVSVGLDEQRYTRPAAQPHPLDDTCSERRLARVQTGVLEGPKMGLEQGLCGCEVRPRPSLPLPLKTLIVMREHSQSDFDATPLLRAANVAPFLDTNATLKLISAVTLSCCKFIRNFYRQIWGDDNNSVTRKYFNDLFSFWTISPPAWVRPSW